MFDYRESRTDTLVYQRWVIGTGRGPVGLAKTDLNEFVYVSMDAVCFLRITQYPRELHWFFILHAMYSSTVHRSGQKRGNLSGALYN